jgi:hypothetical protein
MEEINPNKKYFALSHISIVNYGHLFSSKEDFLDEVHNLQNNFVICIILIAFLEMNRLITFVGDYFYSICNIIFY